MDAKNHARFLHLMQRAQNGIEDAQYRVGMSYLNGELCEQNHNKAIFWLTKAVSADFEKACFPLAKAQFKSAKNATDYRNCLKILRRQKRNRSKESLMLEYTILSKGLHGQIDFKGIMKLLHLTWEKGVYNDEFNETLQTNPEQYLNAMKRLQSHQIVLNPDGMILESLLKNSDRKTRSVINEMVDYLIRRKTRTEMKDPLLRVLFRKLEGEIEKSIYKARLALKFLSQIKAKTQDEYFTFFDLSQRYGDKSLREEVLDELQSDANEGNLDAMLLWVTYWFFGLCADPEEGKYREYLTLLKNSCFDDSPSYNALLGYSQSKGIGLAKNSDKARKYLERIGPLSPEFEVWQIHIVQLCLEGLWDGWNHEQCCDLVIKKAKRNYLPARLLYANLLVQGKHVKRNWNTAIHMAKTCLSASPRRASATLAKIYSNPECPFHNQKKSEALLEEVGIDKNELETLCPNFI